MAIRGIVYLAITLASALVGLGLVLGPIVGWWGGARLCSRYVLLGRRPAWPAMAARELGLAIALTSLLALLGLALGWGAG